MKKVSVILTTYNSSKTLQRTLDSIYMQEGIDSRFELELLIVDDCSTDRTTDILNALGIPYMSTSTNSGGPNKGRNMALQQATGDVIAFIDHDDEWLPNKTILQLQAIEKAPIVSSGYLIKNEPKGTEIKRYREDYTNSDYVFYERNETFVNKIMRNNKGQMAYLSTIMIKNNLKEHLFEQSFGMVDFDWVLRIFESNTSVELNECLMIRHVSDNNLSLSQEYRRKDYFFSLFVLDSYENKYPKEVKEGIRKLNGSRARYFYTINQMNLSRRYFLKSGIELKSMGYLFTSFGGSDYVKKHFNVFG